MQASGLPAAGPTIAPFCIMQKINYEEEQK